MKKLASYLRGVWEEWRKVTFPTWRNTVGLAVLVMVLCVILATYTGVLDLSFGSVIKSIVAK